MDMNQIMAQAQQLQAQMAAAQEELNQQTFEGTAGGGVVTATVLGSGRVVSVEVSPEVIDPSDPELLGDLVTAAVNAALDAANAAAAEAMGGMAGDMGLGGLLG